MKVGERFLDLGTGAENIGTNAILESASRMLINSDTQSISGAKTLNVPAQTPIMQSALTDAIPKFGLEASARCIAYPVYETHTITAAEVAAGFFTLQKNIAPGQQTSLEIAELEGATALAYGIDFVADGENMLKWSGLDMDGRITEGTVITVKYNACRPQSGGEFDLSYLWGWSGNLASEEIITLTRALDGVTVQVQLPTIAGSGMLNLVMAAGELWLTDGNTGWRYDPVGKGWEELITGGNAVFASTVYPMGENMIGFHYYEDANMVPSAPASINLFNKDGTFVTAKAVNAYHTRPYWTGIPGYVKDKYLPWYIGMMSSSNRAGSQLGETDIYINEVRKNLSWQDTQSFIAPLDDGKAIVNKYFFDDASDEYAAISQGLYVWSKAEGIKNKIATVLASGFDDNYPMWLSMGRYWYCTQAKIIVDLETLAVHDASAVTRFFTGILYWQA